MKLRILGAKYDVLISTRDEIDEWGDLREQLHVIRLAGNQPQERVDAVLFHELVEAAAYYGNTKGLQGEANHETLDTFATLLYAILRDNDMLRSNLMERDG